MGLYIIEKAACGLVGKTRQWLYWPRLQGMYKDSELLSLLAYGTIAIVFQLHVDVLPPYEHV